jgi:CRP/FNR family transcriptional regulator
MEADMTIQLAEARDVPALEQYIQTSKESCGNCRLNSTCLPQVLESDEIKYLDDIIQHHKSIQKNQHLYREGDEFRSVYILRTGAIKAYRTTDDGLEQVTRFYFPGEVLGMDGICNNFHGSSAKSLEMAAACEIPFTSLEKLSTKMPNLQHYFFQLMSRQIEEDQQLITLLSKYSAEERVASLMLSLSACNARRKLSATRMRLPMSRIDIGNYLGLSEETVSRTFSRLQKMEILRVYNKEIEVLDTAGLQNLAGKFKPCEKSRRALS